jgi:hypothetical protein
MRRAWLAIPGLALTFAGAFVIGRYSGDAGTDFTHSRVLTVRIAPSVVAIPPQLRLTAEDIQRALRDRRGPIIITVKRR